MSGSNYLKVKKGSDGGVLASLENLSEKFISGDYESACLDLSEASALLSSEIGIIANIVKESKKRGGFTYIYAPKSAVFDILDVVNLEQVAVLCRDYSQFKNYLQGSEELPDKDGDRKRGQNLTQAPVLSLFKFDIIHGLCFLMIIVLFLGILLQKQRMDKDNEELKRVKSKLEECTSENKLLLELGGGKAEDTTHGKKY